MSLPKHQRRAVLSWLFVCALAALCGVLAALQYRWIGEVSVAARERLRGSLQATLARLSQELNREMATAFSGLLPAGPVNPATMQKDLAARYAQWKGAHDRRLLRRLALAVPRKPNVDLYQLDLDRGTISPTPWPAEWGGIRSRLEAVANSEGQRDGQRDGRRGGGPMDPRNAPVHEEFTMTAMLFAPPAGQLGPHNAAWVILDLNPVYVRETLLPELAQRYLGANGSLDYQVEVVAKPPSNTVIYRSDPRQGAVAARADASAGLFDPPQFLNGSGMGGRGGRGLPPPDAGRWQIFVRHRAGSLEAVVAQARWRNLALAAGLLLLIVATAAALIRFTRRTERLAKLQMDFVAGVSHELRTPLTVIHTAGYNLQGKMSRDPAQVEKYGRLIQRESGRLNGMVEQILRFASAESGRVIEDREPIEIAGIIEEAVAASKPLVEGSLCQVEKRIAAHLPVVTGDRAALRQVLENLIGNAVKYGLRGGNWIGVFASRVDGEPPMVEVRVADRGPGIPRDEQDLIFDPFFRGARAMEEQIHGTGLGLSLVKKIVEAHGGSIRVESETLKGTAFVVRLPGARNGAGV